MIILVTYLSEYIIIRKKYVSVGMQQKLVCWAMATRSMDL